MSKARQLADLGNVYDDGALSNRNRIINGNFDVWQRGTSFTAIAGTFGPDRWFVSNVGTGGAGNISQQSFTVGQTDVPNEPTFFMRYSQTTASSDDRDKIFQRIEDVRTFAGKTVTLSFYAKANSAKTFYTRIAQNFGSGGSTTVTTNIGSYNVTTSWQKFTFSFSVPSISGKTIGSSSSLGLALVREESTYTTFDVDVAQVQLEVGDTATPFEHPRSYGDELARCQRYYEVGSTYIARQNNDTLRTETSDCQFSVTKRTAPTMANTNSNSGNVGVADITAANINSWRRRHRSTSTNDFSNQWNWKADAEL